MYCFPAVYTRNALQLFRKEIWFNIHCGVLDVKLFLGLTLHFEEVLNLDNRSSMLLEKNCVLSLPTSI